jgi:putative transcriptional regulator
MKNSLKLKRTIKGWTQEELAQKVGVSRQTIYFIEQSKFTPSTILSLKLASVLECHLEDIFELEKDDWD